VDVIDNNTLFLPKRTYPQLWISLCPWTLLSARKFAAIWAIDGREQFFPYCRKNNGPSRRK
jgi:hypothetical protein